MKNSKLYDVGVAMFHLKQIEKYKNEFEKYPNSFKLRCNIQSQIFEVPLNDVIKREIANYLEEERLSNQKLLDENPELVKIIEDAP